MNHFQISGVNLLISQTAPELIPPLCAEIWARTSYVNISALNSAILEFWYHLYGATMGVLHVDVYANETWHNDVIPPISRNHGDAWYKQTVNLSTYTGIIQVRFRGIPGTSYTSDMAIDDVVIRSGNPYLLWTR